MALRLNRPLLAQIPYKARMSSFYSTNEAKSSPNTPLNDSEIETNSFSSGESRDRASEETYARESSGTPVTPPDEPPVDSNESPESPPSPSPSPSPTPILPANYPPPLPHISRELRDLAFTHKSCAELAAAFNAAKLSEIPTVTDGEAGESASSHVKPFAPVYDNEVSEFVGDSILSAVVSLLLRQWYPHLRPDGLTWVSFLRRQALTDSMPQ